MKESLLVNLSASTVLYRSETHGGAVLPLCGPSATHGSPNHHSHDHDVRGFPTNDCWLFLDLLLPHDDPRTGRNVVR